ncbi:hypothetical protein WDU94_002163 [Cyamophila willieti]
MSLSSEEKRKWKCKFCTYENFPSSIKCTMCREEQVASASLNNDIYQLAYAGPSLCSEEKEEQSSDKPNSNNHETSPVSPSDVKPSLAASSDSSDGTDPPFNTSPLSSKCNLQSSNKSPTSQPESRISQVTTASNIHEHLKPMKISSGESLIKNHQESPARSLHPISPAPSPSPDDQSAIATAPPKWSCVRCTYENWPKASHCVMCNASPRISPRTVSPDGDRGGENAAAKCLIDDRNERRSSNRYHRTIEETCNNLTSQYPSQHYLSKASSPLNLGLNNYDMERRLRAHRKLQATADWAWLNACSGIVGGDYGPVHAYLSGGGDPARQLTGPEVALLNRSSAFDVGHTLVHLAIRFQREDILATLLSHIEGSGSSGVKRVPSYVAPDLAADIRRHVAASMRQRKGGGCSPVPCPFVTDIATFALPAEIEDLPPSIQEQLFEELLDKEAQQQLETEPHPVINWSHEVTAHLYALWNRSAGDCLLDSLMQATWGVFDRENILRRALADSLAQASHLFYPRWKEYEDMHASLLHFSLDETQWEEDWASLVSLASQPGAALEQLHVWALAHILRRPIIVYGVKYVKSFRGEDIGYARFEGVYLPFLWDPGFCSRSPLSLGYTRGAFLCPDPHSALIQGEELRGRGSGKFPQSESS